MEGARKYSLQKPSTGGIQKPTVPPTALGLFPKKTDEQAQADQLLNWFTDSAHRVTWIVRVIVSSRQ
jgi:hypothetical protein